MGIKTCLFMLIIVGIVVHESLAEQPDFCNAPPESGLCLAAFPRYAYMPNTGKCEEFIYGGCDGNENNFNTKQDCENTCANVNVETHRKR